MKQKIKNYSIHFIKEIIPIVAGILIALFIDNWNANRKDQAYINQVFSTVHSELKESREEIEFILPIQKDLVKALEKHADNEEKSLQQIVMESKGIFIPQIKTTAWRSIAATKIDLIDYDKVAAMTNIEDLKQMLSNKSAFLMNLLYSNMDKTDKSIKQTFKMVVLDIIQTENTLEQRIELMEKEGNKKG
ncbi:hypothetical protein HX045_09040 [Myroides odoratimimus]|uniref:Uncharacterized protein n=1 Tax=Myroides odoratimimus CCUG 10230 TaxID=883150 RepID=A0ABP2X203_9FLAO|nr:hypothetical protein [Myroides odoratimimus]EHO11472.1 hypothetical protein HMPREF9714_01366 [Myroides odoratimimus CCUG 12901]EKB07834.1 hypothetical protein HMPREF9711_00124 [Myroides odoratimimus CCUG 3837]EPC08720.1 hypothetical protein HMPREF9712_03572 [Myroides odoratimimus CCUG 10230]MCA4808015.1 hypothetical protein [Myroides odoratimimus]MDM1060147.1 hypothetical protein [Myroides odoratimimus]